MKYPIATLILILTLIGCDPHENFGFTDEQASYASKCSDILWSNNELAQFNMVNHIGLKELYKECGEDFKKKPSMRFVLSNDKLYEIKEERLAELKRLGY